MKIIKKINKIVAKIENSKNFLLRLIMHYCQVFNKKLAFKLESPKDYISIVAIAKNEGFYIEEWVKFHKLVGVDRIYLYDNGSTDDTKQVLDKYIKEGFVVYIDFKGDIKQLKAYRHAIKNFGHNSFWMAFIDIDEFLTPVNFDNIKLTLKEFEKFPALVVNWVVYDGNDHETRPEGPVIENYTRIHETPSDDDLIVKTIAQPKEIFFTDVTPHTFLLKRNQKAVTENKEENNSPRTKTHSIKKIRLNHYCSKSLEEYEIKANRGCADHYGESKVNMKLFHFEDGINDCSMEKYVELIKQC